MTSSGGRRSPNPWGWLHLDLVKIPVLTVLANVAYTVTVAPVPAAARPGWLLAIAAGLLLACLVLLWALQPTGPRALGRGYVAFFIAFVCLFSLAADMDLLVGPRIALAGYEKLPANAFGLGWLEDWHYWMAPRAPKASRVKVVELPSFRDKTREEVRQVLAFLIRKARGEGALGIAFDIYLDKDSEIDFLLRLEVEAAREDGFPVVFGYRLEETESGDLKAFDLPRQLRDVAQYRGHLQAYQEADGRIRLIPPTLPEVGEHPALSVTVAGLIAGHEPDLATDRLSRFVRPPDGVEAIPFDRDRDWSILSNQFVFVGSGSENDRVETPFGEVQGVEVHAWAAHAMATDSALVDVDRRTTLLLIFAFCYMLTVLHASGSRPPRLAGAALGLSGAVMLAAMIAIRERLWLEVSYPLLAVWLLTALHLVMALIRKRIDSVSVLMVESEDVDTWELGDASTVGTVFADQSSAVEMPTIESTTRSRNDGSYDVFLCHNSRDKPMVRELYARLRARGLMPWLNEEELRPGVPWQEGLETGLEASTAVAVLVSENGLSPWQDAEIRGALSYAVGDGKPMIPVLLPGISEQPKLPLFLSNYMWVDLGDGLTRQGLDRLEWGITGRRPAAAA